MAAEVTDHGDEAAVTEAAPAQVEFKPEVTGAEAPAPPADAKAPEAPKPATPARPEWLPEEFQTPEQMAQAYAAIKAGAKQAEGETPPAAEEKPPASETPAADPVVEIVTKAGMDFSEIQAHYAEHDSLTDEHYAKFAAAGYAPRLVNQFLAGTKALIADYRGRVFAAVGGEELFGEAANWAASNLSEKELAAYNEAVDSLDFERAQLAVAGVIGKYQGAVGREPNLAEGAGPGGSAVQGFESRAQLVAAQRDTRYAKDPAFRAEVEKKLAASMHLFNR